MRVFSLLYPLYVDLTCTTVSFVILCHIMSLYFPSIDLYVYLMRKTFKHNASLVVKMM